jgi:hypothetical protein
LGSYSKRVGSDLITANRNKAHPIVSALEYPEYVASRKDCEKFIIAATRTHVELKKCSKAVILFLKDLILAEKYRNALTRRMIERHCSIESQNCSI